jgi:hypothetical protein
MSDPLHGANWPPGDHDLPEAPLDLSVWTLVALALYAVFVVAATAMLLAPEDCPAQTAVFDPEACAAYERTPAYWAERGY